MKNEKAKTKAMALAVCTLFLVVLSGVSIAAQNVSEDVTLKSISNLEYITSCDIEKETLTQYEIVGEAKGYVIKYDDGEADDGLAATVEGMALAVHFTNTCPSNNLKTAKFHIAGPPAGFAWKVYGWTGSAPGSVIASGIATPTETGWHEVNIGETVPEDFVIAMYWTVPLEPYLGVDYDAPISDRSFMYIPDEGWIGPFSDVNIRIRAVMEEEVGTSVTISTDKASYTAGDTMSVGLDITNPGAALPVRFAIWLEMPGGGIHVLTYMSTPITLPAGLPYSNENFAVITLPSIPEGTYTWNAALIEPSGPIEFIAHDTATWMFGAAGAEQWAVIIGEADYVGTVNDLDYTDDDARDMRDALISGGWEADHIQLLIDANRATIEGAIDWLATNAGPGDTALFFFSGHGTYSTDVYPFDETDGYDEYICPTDSDNIRDDELDAKLDTIDSDVAIAVIIDSCFSGGMGKAADIDLKAKTLPKPKVELETGDGFAKDCGEPGRVVLMACDEDEVSYEITALENGFFTYFLVNGLSGAADANSNGEVSAEEAFGYTDPLVLFYTGGEQDPQIYDGYTGELGITILLKSVFKLPPLILQ